MRVLVIDDSPTFQAAAGDALEEAGFEVESAPNGLEGVAMARSWKPSLIVMDIEMPVKRGDQAARELRADPELKKIPIIAMTSFSPEKLGDASELFDDFLIKPFGFAELIPLVKKLIGKDYI